MTEWQRFEAVGLAVVLVAAAIAGVAGLLS